MKELNLIQDYTCEYKEYNVDNALSSQDDNDMMNCICDYSEDSYIGDIISEIANNNVSIFSSDVLDETKNLYYSGAYEDASFQGLMEGTDDLIDQLRIAWYAYNTMQLYNNQETLIYNYAINHIKTGKYLTQDELNELANELKNIDNNDTFQNIIDTIDNIISNRD